MQPNCRSDLQFRHRARVSRSTGHRVHREIITSFALDSSWKALLGPEMQGNRTHKMKLKSDYNQLIYNKVLSNRRE